MNRKEIIDFILQQQHSNGIWPWFVSMEEMVGNPQSLREVEQLLGDMATTQDYNPSHVSAALTEVFGANPYFLEELHRTPYGLFTITAEGETQHYCAENFCEIQEVLDLLHRVHTAKDRLPTITQSDMAQLVMYSKSRLPISVYPPLRLFQPITAAEFEGTKKNLQSYPNENTVILLNYDNDRWEHSQWSQEGWEHLSAPLSEAISVFGQALEKRGHNRIHLKESVLAEGLERICELSVTPSPSEQQNHGPTMEMKM